VLQYEPLLLQEPLLLLLQDYPPQSGLLLGLLLRLLRRRLALLPLQPIQPESLRLLPLAQQAHEQIVDPKSLQNHLLTGEAQVLAQSRRLALLPQHERMPLQVNLN
jgi:hypothetical protein